MAAVLPKVTIQQLEYLDAVLAAPTWNAAATELGVSPSALSQGLAELEKRIGVPLFTWRGRQRVIADDVQPVVDYTRRVLADSRDLSDWIERRRSGKAGLLRVGMIDVGAVHHYPDHLAAFRSAHPDVELRLMVSASQTLLNRLAAGELDLAVCVAPEGPSADRSDGLVVTHLLDEPLAVYAPGRQKIGKPDTWGPWITFPAESLTRKTVAAALRKLGAPFDVVAESHQPDVIREMVNLSLGWTVLPRVQAERGDRPLRRAVKADLTTRQLVAARRESATNPLIDELLGRLSGVVRSTTT